MMADEPSGTIDPKRTKTEQPSAPAINVHPESTLHGPFGAPPSYVEAHARVPSPRSRTSMMADEGGRSRECSEQFELPKWSESDGWIWQTW